MNAYLRITVIFILVFGVCFFTSRAYDHTSPSNSSALISIDSTSHFFSVLNENEFIFVKFFNPMCSHCRAMAPSYINLSHILSRYNQNDSTPSNRTVACLEVDTTKKANRALKDQYNVVSVPTLLFFHGNSTYFEYNGARTPDAMFTFIMSSLLLAEGPKISHLHAMQDVLNFKKLVEQRPFVLSVLYSNFDERKHFPATVHLPYQEWLETTSSISSHPVPVFATVSDPSLLVPSEAPCLARFRELSKPYAVPPIAVAAPAAESMCDQALWYFPGVRDSESLSSFVHTSIIGKDEYITLTSQNSRHVVNTDRPIMFVIGADVKPDFSAHYSLSLLSSMNTTNPVVTVYVHRPSFPNLVEYLHVSKEKNSSAMDNEEHDVILYYYGNMGPVIRLFKPMGNISLSTWALNQASSLDEMAVRTIAGSVFTLNQTSWSAIFDFDPRSVLLLLTGNDIYKHRKMLEKVAKLLGPYSGSVVVAVYDDETLNGERGRADFPKTGPDLSEVTDRPVLMLVTPGEGVRVYSGAWSAMAVAKFVRLWIGAQTGFPHGMTRSDVLITGGFAFGTTLVFAALVNAIRQRQKPAGRYWQRIPLAPDESKKL